MRYIQATVFLCIPDDAAEDDVEVSKAFLVGILEGANETASFPADITVDLDDSTWETVPEDEEE